MDSNFVVSEADKRKIYDYLKKCNAEGYFSEVLQDEADVKAFLRFADEGELLGPTTIMMYLEEP